MKPKTDICLKCGRCCHYLFNGKLKRCKYLNDNNTCKIYHRRLGVRIDKGMLCKLRVHVRANFEGCPYNKDSWD